MSDEYKEKKGSRLKWKDINPTHKQRFEQSHPWHFTFDKSEKYAEGWERIFGKKENKK